MRHQIVCPHCGSTAALVTITPSSDKARVAPIHPDWLAAFLKERCRLNAGARVTSAELWSAYDAWAILTGRSSASPKALGMELSRVPGVRRIRGAHGLRMFSGLDLR